MAQELDVTAPYSSEARTCAGAVKRVLIVDDSRAMRAWLRTVMASDARLEVVGEAGDAVQARDFIKANPVDVLTLDIEMPGMSGLDFLTRLMRARPMPVVMMSSLTAAGSEAAIQALSRGAIDCMVKPTSGYGEELTHDICERVYHASCTRPSQLQMWLQSKTVDQSAPAAPVSPPASRAVYRRDALILIGASTGGVTALETVLPTLDPHGPPVVIVQHMPGNFLASFSERLNRQLPQNVYLANEDRPVESGDIVLAPGNNQHTEVKNIGGNWYCRFAPNDPPALHCPSVDVMFASAANAPQARHITAALLTGLGRDGADGLLKLAQAGATTFGQDEATCVVYGMPKAAMALGAVQTEAPLESIGPAIRESRVEQPRDDTQRIAQAR